MNGLSFRKRYWRAALFVPPLVAVAIYVTGLFSTAVGYVLLGGSVILAIPYVPFLPLMWWLIGRTRSNRQLVALAVAAPFVLVGVGFPAATVASLLGFAQPWWKQLAFAAGISGLTVLFGYAYIALLALVLSIWLHFRDKPSPRAGVSAGA